MSQLDRGLKRFVGRVRWLRAWQGMGWGALAAGVVASAWAGLDLAAVAFAEWSWLGLLVLAGAALGALVGALRPLPMAAVATSVDRRARLQDRLTTARSHVDSSLADPLAHDAQRSLAGVDPRSTYPVRPGAGHYGAMAACACAAGLFAFGNFNPFAAPQEANAKARSAEKATEVRRVARTLETPGSDAATKELANNMKRLAREMEKGRLSEKQTMQRANAIADDAKELAQDKAQRANQAVARAQEHLASAALEKSNANEEALRQLGDAEKALLQQALDKASLESGASQELAGALSQNDLKAAMEAMNKMSPEEREALEKAMRQAAAEQGEAGKQAMQNLARALELSEEAKKALAEFMNSPEARELQKLIQEMQAANKQVGKGKPLTEEQIKQMEQRLEALAKDLKDPELRKKLLDELRKAMEELKKGNQAAGACLACLGLGMSQELQPGQGAAGTQYAFPDLDRNHTGSPDLELKGKTDTKAVRGERDEERGTDRYVEIKAPSAAGERSSVPYDNLLPKYSRAAESAIRSQKVPKQHQGRVRDYFNALQGGGGK